MFEIKITTKNEELILNNLTEKEALEVLADAYDCIVAEKEYITFKNRATVKAIDLEAFYIL